jgi:tetratricopeptide (TPR) repeat protein
MISWLRNIPILVFAVVYLGAPLLSYGQECSCPEYKAGEKGNTQIAQLERSHNPICNAKAYELQALIHLKNKAFDQSETYFRKAEEIYKQTACTDSVLLTTYMKWAQLYYTKSDYAKAQHYTLKFLKAAESAGNRYEQAISYTMLAQLLNQMGQAHKGIAYTRRVVPLLDQLNTMQQADVLRLLSKRYLWHYQDTQVRSSLDSSELFSRRLLGIGKRLSLPNEIANAYNDLQGVAYERGQYTKAVSYLDSAFRYIGKDDFEELAVAYFDKADILKDLKNYKEARVWADSALAYNKKLGNATYTAENYSLIADIARKQGDFKEALQFSEASHTIIDSVRNVEKTRQVVELERTYNQARNEGIIRDLEKQKQIYLLIAVIMLLSLLLGVFFVRQQNRRNRQKMMDTEARLNRARMNPHFFFNVLSSLQVFALRSTEQGAVANKILMFAHIMRESLESTYKDYNTLEQENEFLTDYLELQQMRFPRKFAYQINTDETLEARSRLARTTRIYSSE